MVNMGQGFFGYNPPDFVLDAARDALGRVECNQCVGPRHIIYTEVLEMLIVVSITQILADQGTSDSYPRSSPLHLIAAVGSPTIKESPRRRIPTILRLRDRSG